MMASKYDLEALYRYLCEYKKENSGNSPTFSEIRSALGIASSSQVSLFLRDLADQGRIYFDHGRCRNIGIRGSLWLPPDGYESKHLAECSYENGILVEQFKTENRIGRIRIAYELFLRADSLALGKAMRLFFIIRAGMIFQSPWTEQSGEIEYTAYSSLFESLPEGEDPPLYRVLIDSSSTGIYQIRAERL